MDSFKAKKDILQMTRAHILRMPNTILKAKMVRNYESLLYYYDLINQIRHENISGLGIDPEYLSKYYRHIVSATTKNLCDIETISPFLLTKYQEIIDTYKEEGFCSFECEDYKKVNISKMYSLVIDFFAFLGEDVLKIYYDMTKDNNIILTSLPDFTSFALNSTMIDNPCVVMQNCEKYLDYYFTLAHEIGHCYQFYLQRNQHDFTNFDPFCEITSLLFEKLFAKFLKENDILKNNYFDLLDHVYFLNDVAASKILCKLFINDHFEYINPYDRSYESFVPKDILLDEMVKDCGYIMPNKLELNLEEFHYSIGGAIATYFSERLNDNFSLEWKNFKNFICTVNYLPMGEVINEYFDTDIIKKKIKEFMVSYRNR